MAHELGHLAHFGWREQDNLPSEDSPWWQLYTEGFAQRCEGLILGRSSWHMQKATSDRHWQAWCQENLGWLASEFLRRVDQDEDMRPFFGSWYDLRGHKQTGYFLGHEIIKVLQKQMSLQKIAKLTNIESYLKLLLTQMTS